MSTKIWAWSTVYAAGNISRRHLHARSAGFRAAGFNPDRASRRYCVKSLVFSTDRLPLPVTDFGDRRSIELTTWSWPLPPGGEREGRWNGIKLKGTEVREGRSEWGYETSDNRRRCVTNVVDRLRDTCIVAVQRPNPQERYCVFARTSIVEQHHCIRVIWLTTESACSCVPLRC